MICRTLLLVLVVSLCATACTPADPIDISHAWLRAPAPGLSVAAGYFDIVNRGNTPIELIGARCESAGPIEIHTHVHDGDVMQMRQLKTVALPPGHTVSFTSGGLHLMVFGFNDVTSNPIPITLLFSDASQRTVAFEVRKLNGANQR